MQKRRQQFQLTRAGSCFLLGSRYRGKGRSPDRPIEFQFRNLVRSIWEATISGTPMYGQKPCDPVHAPASVAAFLLAGKPRSNQAGFCPIAFSVDKSRYRISEQTNAELLSSKSARMNHQRKDVASKIDLEIEASMALEEARAMAHGIERVTALKKAGTLQNAALSQCISFNKRGRPAKT